MSGHNYAISSAKRPKCQRKGTNLVRTWFNQPGRKLRRRQTRLAKAKRCFPRPMDRLRPSVTCSSFKYNLKQRIGRGFSLAELKAAKICVKKARQLGISVDPRRRNKSQESIDRNVARLQEYLSKLIVFSKEATDEQIKSATQQTGIVMPLTTPVPKIERASVADQTVLPHQFNTIRNMKTASKHRHMALLIQKKKATQKK